MNPTEKPEAGNPKLQYIASCIGIIFFGVAFLTLGAIMPAVAAEYGLSDKMSATLAAILPIGTLAGSLVFGPVVDRKGYKLVMIVQNLIGAAGLFLPGWLQRTGRRITPSFSPLHRHFPRRLSFSRCFPAV